MGEENPVDPMIRCLPCRALVNRSPQKASALMTSPPARVPRAQ
jgi:hypothetical protein